jgi:hypothetical protein
VLPFKAVEAVLAQTFGVDDRYRGRFVERLKHLRKLGAIEVTPGKGQVVDYDRDQMLRLLLVLSLSDAGFDASLIVATITPLWSQLARVLDLAQKAPIFLAVRPAFMAGTWHDTPIELAWCSYHDRVMHPLKKQPVIRLPNLNKPPPDPPKIPGFDWLTPEQPQLTLINISARLARFNQALDNVSQKTQVDNKKRRRS